MEVGTGITRMVLLHPRHLALLGMMLLLGACGAEQTPQAVAAAFWQAVIDNRPQAVVELSTLSDPVQYDGFARDWQGVRPSWGKVVIDGEEASILTELSGPVPEEESHLRFVTHLVYQNATWQVDYERTRKGLGASASLQQLFTKINRLGQSLAGHIETASRDFSTRMDSLVAQLRQQAPSFDAQAPGALAHHAETLRRHIEALIQSLEHSLQLPAERVSDGNRHRLHETLAELNTQHRALERPSLQVITDSGQAIARARRQLEVLDEPDLQEYKQQWQQWTQRFEAELQHLLDRLASKT